MTPFVCLDSLLFHNIIFSFRFLLFILFFFLTNGIPVSLGAPYKYFKLMCSRPALCSNTVKQNRQFFQKMFIIESTEKLSFTLEIERQKKNLIWEFFYELLVHYRTQKTKQKLDGILI